MQVSDGAAAVLLMTRREADRRGMPILGIFRSFAAVGVDPAVMGIGPAHAIPAALKLAHLSVEDIDLFELNEAFASQVCIHFPFEKILHLGNCITSKLPRLCTQLILCTEQPSQLLPRRAYALLKLLLPFGRGSSVPRAKIIAAGKLCLAWHGRTPCPAFHILLSGRFTMPLDAGVIRKAEQTVKHLEMKTYGSLRHYA